MDLNGEIAKWHNTPCMSWANVDVKGNRELLSAIATAYETKYGSKGVSQIQSCANIIQ